MTRIGLVVAVAASCAAAAFARTDASEAAPSAAIAAVLAAPEGFALDERLAEPQALARFYRDRENRPAWSDDLAHDLLAAVRRSDEQGLRPDAYHLKALTREIAGDRSAPDRLASLDVLLSDSFLHLAHDLAEGAIDPRSLHAGFERPPGPALDAARVLAAGLDAGRISDALAQCAPPHGEYAALVRALARLRRAQDPGDKAAAVHADQVRASLERWRWLPRDLGRRHLLVNAASFQLDGFESGERRLGMKVVVGEKDWQTPLAHGVISHLVLNPAWRVPRSIATREMLPAAKRDRSYFRTRELQVWSDGESGASREVDSARVDWRRIEPAAFPYHVRQPPGPHNPLGRIKFVFANPYGVYLHGTPGDLAFARGLRAMSHGCVRVEDEVALAEFALAPDPSWTHERLLETLREAWEFRLRLPEPLPVYLVYFTATARPDGTAQFSRDSYGWDRELIAALEAR
jgi:murein L,D-transpeptidase YcbB/YkuD